MEVLKGPHAFRQFQDEFEAWYQETLAAQIDHLKKENDRLYFALWEISKIGEVLCSILALISSCGNGDLGSNLSDSPKALQEVNERMNNMEDCVAKEIEEMN